jgi:hypothetical protein
LNFKIRSSPSQEAADDPRQTEETHFVSLNSDAVAADWFDDGRTFKVNFDLDEKDGQVPGLEAVERVGRAGTAQRHPTPSSKGGIVLQQRGPDIIHVEYWPEILRGQTLDPAPAGEPDRDVEEMLLSWLRANELSVATIVRENSGELR